MTVNIKKPLKIAVMGCVVNGLGEGREADFALVGAKNHAIFMKEGKIFSQVSKKDALKIIKKELENYKED